MSYILDALRKSDQQRQRGAAPTLRTAPVTAGAPRQPALLLYGSLAAVLLGAGIAIGWLRPWQPEQPPAPQAVVAKPHDSSPREAAPAPGFTREPVPELRPRESVPAAQSAPAPMPRVMPAGANAMTRSTAPIAAKTAPEEATPAPEESVDTGRREQEVMTMAELPVPMLEQIPKLSISVHAYSAKRADRLVGINGRLLREGDYPAPDLRLEQITPDGMILSYKGYRFRHGVR
jgi:general secretion pathway protein B